MIYVSENKAQIVKGDYRPAQFYKGKKKIAGYERASFEGNGTVTLENCYNDRLYSAKIYGNTLQNEVPTPETPVPMQSVGDLVTEGEHTGKYRITVVAYNDRRDTGFEIHLDEPLRKVGKFEDYIDFENKKVIRNVTQHVLTGAEGWYRENYRIFTEIGSQIELDANKVNCLSNRFDAYSWNILFRNSYLDPKTIGIALQRGGYINVTPSQEIPTVKKWKEQLDAWNNDGNPLTVICVDTQTEEVIELPEIPTLRGNTNYEISTSANSRISGEYKKTEE